MTFPFRQPWSSQKRQLCLASPPPSAATTFLSFILAGYLVGVFPQAWFSADISMSVRRRGPLKHKAAGRALVVFSSQLLEIWSGPACWFLVQVELQTSSVCSIPRSPSMEPYWKGEEAMRVPHGKQQTLNPDICTCCPEILG